MELTYFNQAPSHQKLLHSAPLNRPPLLPSIPKSDDFGKCQVDTMAENLARESLETSSDRSVLDPEDNLFEIFPDKMTLNSALTSFFADECEVKEKEKADFHSKSGKRTRGHGTAHRENDFNSGHRSLCLPCAESGEELQKAALLGDILAQWRLSRKMEKSISPKSSRENLENLLTSVLTNKSSGNRTLTHYKHRAHPLHSRILKYLPSLKQIFSTPCSHSFSFTHSGSVSVSSSQQLACHSEEKSRSISPQFDSNSRLTAVLKGVIQNAIPQYNDRITPQKINSCETGIQCCLLVLDKLSGQPINPPSRSVGVQPRFSSMLTSCGCQTSPPSKRRIRCSIAVQCDTLFSTSLPSYSQPASQETYKTRNCAGVDCLSVAEYPGNAGAEGGEKKTVIWLTPMSTPQSSFTLVSSLPPSPDCSIRKTRSQSHSHSQVCEEGIHHDTILVDLVAARSTCARKLELVEKVIQQKWMNLLFRNLPNSQPTNIISCPLHSMNSDQ
uniref:Uncharacterized protein n=1 Tax=Echinococcus canadensis TaxID=519352 RepID=A0A915EVS7_9CEST